MHGDCTFNHIKAWLPTFSHTSFPKSSNLLSINNASIYRHYGACTAGPNVGPIVSLGMNTTYLAYTNNILKEIIGNALYFLLQHTARSSENEKCKLYSKHMARNDIQYGPLLSSATYAFLLGDHYFFDTPDTFLASVRHETTHITILSTSVVLQTVFGTTNYARCLVRLREHAAPDLYEIMYGTNKLSPAIPQIIPQEASLARQGMPFIVINQNLPVLF